MIDNKVKLNERGDKIGGMEKKGQDLEAASKAYLDRAREINRQQKEKPGSGGFFNSLFK